MILAYKCVEVLKEVMERKELVIKGLHKTYKKRRVVDDVSFEIRRGEVVGLLGPNGAGKTTSFYMVVGLILPDKRKKRKPYESKYMGTIFLDDRDITEYPMYRRSRMGIGYLAQEASIFRKLTVEQNIMAILEISVKSKEEREEKLENLIEEFDLHKVRKSKGYQLSGGERRRTEISRALASNPGFLLLDEPFAGIDPIAVQDIQVVINQLKEKNIGILITDHNARETLRITDRSYIMSEGKILYYGGAEELANNEEAKKVYLGDSFRL